MTLRHILGSIVALISILILPYWIYLPILLVVMVYVPFFWEGILFGAMIDVMYGGGYSNLASMIFSFAFYASLTLVIIMPIRERLRFNV